MDIDSQIGQEGKEKLKGRRKIESKKKAKNNNKKGNKALNLSHEIIAKSIDLRTFWC